MTDLKPCPFCGGEARHNGTTPVDISVWCDDCGGWNETPEMWNARATPLQVGQTTTHPDERQDAINIAILQDALYGNKGPDQQRIAKTAITWAATLLRLLLAAPDEEN